MFTTLAVVSALFGLLLGSDEPVLPRLELAPAARAALTAFATSPTERLGCLHGSLDGATVRVDAVVATDGRGLVPPRRLPGGRDRGGPTVVLAGVAIPFAPGADSVTHKWIGGPAVDVENALALAGRSGRQLDWGYIERWARALRSGVRPRISQSVRLTTTYRRPMGARLGVIVDF